MQRTNRTDVFRRHNISSTKKDNLNLINEQAEQKNMDINVQKTKTRIFNSLKTTFVGNKQITSN